MSDELRKRIGDLRKTNPWQAIDLLLAEVERLQNEIVAALKKGPKAKRRAR